jgi:hypothetical protein
MWRGIDHLPAPAGDAANFSQWLAATSAISELNLPRTGLFGNKDCSKVVS